MNTHRVHQRDVSFANDIAIILDVLRRKAWIICVCVFGAAILGLLYIRVTPKVYSSSAVIQIEQEGPDLIKVEGSRGEDLKAAEVVKTFEQSISSPEVLMRVIRDESLAKRPEFLADVKRPAPDGAMQEALAKKIKAKLRFETRLIDISVQDQNPLLAKEIASTLLREFIAWNYEAKREAVQLSNQFLIEEADRLKDRLVNSEQTLQKYREENDAVSLEERQNIIVEKLRELNTRVTVAKAERLKLEADVSQLRSPNRKSVSDLLQIPAIAGAADVLEISKSIFAKEALMAQLAQRYGARHHKMVEAEKELDRLKTELVNAARNAAQVLEFSHGAALLNEQKLEAALREQERLALDLNRIGIPYSALMRNVEADRTMYNLVLTRLKETDITKDLAGAVIRVVARPILPHRPIKPHKTLILALSLMAGLATGGAVAFGFHAADRTVTSSRDAEALLGLKTLAEIRNAPSQTRGRGKILSLPNADPAVSNSFRSLTSSLLLCGDGQAPKSIMFTAAQHGSGTTFCAAGCAISFAKIGMKTLLVGADLRGAGTRNLFFDEPNHGRECAGRSEEDQWESQTHSTQIANLFLLSTQTDDSTVDKMQASERMKRILQWASSRYDVVIVDSAPVDVGSDSLHIARLVQAVCLVIPAGRTPQDEVAAAARRLEEAGAQVVGFAWNRAQSPLWSGRKRPLSSDILYEDLAATRLHARIAKAEPQVLSRIEAGDGPRQNDRNS